MSIKVELGIGRIISVDRDTATIGQDPGADIRIPDSLKIQPIHARIVKVANRWMIQSAGDWLLQVGDGVPGRKLWLNSGDLIHLSESGPYLVFDPQPIAPKPIVQLGETAAAAGPTSAANPEIPPFLQPIAQAKPEKPEKPKKPQSVKPPDEEDEVWQEVFGYWMEDRQK
jgi:pSer/pThr/pTyr-binding forkhead associated (FHA) protein